jgi:hypothetical protein
MPKELFNQTVKTTLDESDRIAVGIPGMIGANNISAANLLKQSSNWNIITGTFNNSNLIDGTWTYNHNKNTTTIRLTLRNPSGYEQCLGGILKVVNTNTIQIEFGGSIDSGDWTYIFEYILT